MVKERPPTDAEGDDADGGVSTPAAFRQAIGQYRAAFDAWLRRAGLKSAAFGLAVAMFAETAAAAPVVLQAGGDAGGWCAVPGGAVVLPWAVLLAQGVLVVAGGAKAIGAMAGGDGGGDYGSNSGRMAGVFGVGIAAVGFLLPRLATFTMGEFGTTAAEMGLGCAF